MKHAFIYLASQSPRRKQLLEQIGVAARLLLPAADEDAEGLEQRLGRESPKAYVQRVTLLKLQMALARRKQRGLPVAPVLCADTTVALGGSILGKPVDDADACRILTRLSNRTHRVFTAVAVGTARRQEMLLSESAVCFAALSAPQIRAYVASGEPMGKAGAYAVQGRAGQHIQHIRGSYTGIMGLPLFETVQLLRSFSVE